MMKVCSVKSADHLIILESKERTQEFAERIQTEIDKNGECAIEVTKPKRSLNANAYMWVLCSKIAEKLNKSKDDIYLKAIRDVGSFEFLPIKQTAVNDFLRHWNGRGLGWFAEIVGESKLNGYINVIAYFGSSAYDTKEMSRLIDYVKADAEELGIQVMPESELKSLVDSWGG